MRVATVNVGSSSVKVRLLEDDSVRAAYDLPSRHGALDGAALADTLASLRDVGGPVDAVGHRVVHGGREFVEAVRIDAGVERRLRALTDLAPLHQPGSLAGIDAARRALPDVPAVACFDTAFHAGMRAAAATYAIPRTWREDYGVHRYGFHGLSHAYATRRCGDLLGRDPGRLVVCHLGAGASLAAVRDGRSVDTTMGFTPLEGLVMATRPGSVDPGLVLWLHQHAGVPLAEIADALEHRCGLVALAGTGDMGDVLASAGAGAGDARLAVDVYVHRLRAGIAAMAAALDGLDVLAFTGGVGENAPQVRALAGAGLAFLGVAIDPVRNAAARPDAEITAPGGRVRTFVVAAREDLQIATEVRRALETPSP